MSVLEKYNLKSNDIISLVKSLARAISYSTVRIRYIVSNVNDEWYNVICVIRAFTSEEAVIKKEPEYRKYDGAFLGQCLNLDLHYTTCGNRVSNN
jgi:hypothetical protein